MSKKNRLIRLSFHPEQLRLIQTALQAISDDVAWKVLADIEIRDALRSVEAETG